MDCIELYWMVLNSIGWYGMVCGSMVWHEMVWKDIWGGGIRSWSEGYQCDKGC